MYQQRSFKEVMQEWDRIYNEFLLGYQVELIFIDGENGLPLNKTKMVKAPTNKKTDSLCERIIEYRWENAQKSFKAIDNPRARFEGYEFDTDGKLQIFWSDDKYKNHVATRDAMVGKGYLPNLWTINIVPFTKDYKIPKTIKNPKTTDQGRIMTISPLGFANPAEELPNTFKRVFESEWEIPEGALNIEDARLLGIAYNSRKNNDYTAVVYSPMKCNSSDLVSKKLITPQNPNNKYDSIEWVDANKQGLESLFHELCSNLDTNPGHYRADVALTYGLLYGGRQAYLNLLDDTLLRIADEKFEKELIKNSKSSF